ncbi:MAG: secretin N-terminal domain-containing protein [Planctomycetota bacterium]|jgi:type II secretion system protein D
MIQRIRSARLSQRLCLVVALLIATIGFIRWDTLSAETIAFEAYSLRYAEPEQARQMLGDLAGQTQIVVDARKRQLLVRGPAEVQQMTRQLLKEFDRAQSLPAAQSQASVPRTLRSYPCSAAQLDDCVAILRERLAGIGRVTIDRNRNRIMVVAPADVQQQIERFVTSFDSPVPPPLSLTPPAAGQLKETSPVLTATASPRASDVTANQSTDAVVPIRVRTLEAIRNALTQLLGEQLRLDSEMQLRFVDGTASDSILRLDAGQSAIQLAGPAGTVQQLATLLQWLDAPPQPAGQVQRFVPLQKIDPITLNRALQAWRQSSVRSHPLHASQQSLAANDVQPANFQQDSDAPAQPADDDPQRPRQLRRPLSDVEIEALPDLDVLMLRGRDVDVEELTRIIRELERLEAEASPEIEVYLLRNVKGESLNTLIAQVLDDLAGPLAGRVSITPLVKPNGLLLIGWGEAVNAAKKLIAELDQSVDPGTQMRVFTLKNAAAAQVQNTVENFLNGRGGLGPDVSVTADSRTNALIVYAAPRDLLEVATLIERLDTGTTDSVKRVRMIRLKNSLATDIAATLDAAIATARGGSAAQRSAALEMLMVDPNGQKLIRSGLLNDVQITPDTRTNTLFVSGPEDSLPLIEALVAELDRNPAASAQIKVFEVVNGDAGDLVLVLRSLFPQAATSNVPQLATAEDEPSLVPVRFSVDIRTNSIIATGSSGDLQIIEALLLRLDEASTAERVTQVYRLKNSPALDVNQAVNEFLRSERIVAQAAPGRMNAFAQIESEVIVVAEPVTNSLIISATPRYFDEVMELVERLDEQPAKVMIQVILAEVELNNFHEFGVELGIQDSLLFDRSLLGNLITTTSTTSTSTPSGVVTTTSDTIQSASNTPGFDFNNNPLGNSGSTQSLATAGSVAGQALSHFSMGRVSSDLEYGGLVLSAGSENISVLLRALDESRNIEILSRPQIMTLDNQPAFIQVGQRVPRIVGTNINQVGQVNSIELENVGLILGVTPRISPDGMVVMELDAEKSNLGPEADGIPVSVSSDGGIIRSPRVNITTAQTTVSAASGETIIIGGLITTENTTISRRVPWLSEVPLVGELFKFDGSSNIRKELLIILTPNVIRDSSQSEHLKQLEMARMSWISQDIHEWLDPNAGYLHTGSFDDSGVPIIYPDQTPGMEWATPPAPQEFPAAPAADHAQTSGSGSAVTLPAPSTTDETRGALLQKSQPLDFDTSEGSARVRIPSQVRQVGYQQEKRRRRFSIIPRWFRKNDDP